MHHTTLIALLGLTTYTLAAAEPFAPKVIHARIAAPETTIEAVYERVAEAIPTLFVRMAQSSGEGYDPTEEALFAMPEETGVAPKPTLEAVYERVADAIPTLFVRMAQSSGEGYDPTEEALFAMPEETTFATVAVPTVI